MDINVISHEHFVYDKGVVCHPQKHQNNKVVWLKGQVSELGMKQNVILFQYDSQSMIYLAKNQVYHARTKHISVRYHRVHDWVNSCKVKLQKVRMDENVADMIAKPFTMKKFRHCQIF